MRRLQESARRDSHYVLHNVLLFRNYLNLCFDSAPQYPNTSSLLYFSCPWADSNGQPLPPQGSVLSIELQGLIQFWFTKISEELHWHEEPKVLCQEELLILNYERLEFFF